MVRRNLQQELFLRREQRQQVAPAADQLSGPQEVAEVEGEKRGFLHRGQLQNALLMYEVVGAGVIDGAGPGQYAALQGVGVDPSAEELQIP